ncbi:RagB/SusD family nutrient uptake outer membrane protein [Salegentibacter maritimus]|uniref:RagB/SusD family nutrient uptake outer membrane protein n=1 Tax=Salegentibacter maritimus TaxID=2794347 RepID=A0ABS0TIQ5_9FLAO|nr:RagB/SusD family nutrient uptake outer membrane protein [Salegentibacter maritimus]MBI6116146.1 RagB/SusD family nutrient uptake outer membrane protein [Salegentibacter maritimus]MBI6120902.1 RagB/SusD family nutrient uptake outer membrane protein [Salegentibacter maritimus]
MHYKHILLIVVIGFSLFSCSQDFLDKEPISEVTTENFFATASDLQLYTNGFYRMFPSTSIYNGDSKTDNIIEIELSAEMRGARFVPTSGGGWNWAYLRDINFFLENYERSDDEAAKSHYGGVARFFRAYFYFEKLQRFGEVPWYDKTIDPADEETLTKPRDSRQFIVDKILEDLDWAIANMQADQQVYEVTKYAALALKSRVGLYEGTYMKYRDIAGYEKYLESSIKASEELINNSPYSIYSTGKPLEDYANLFNAHEAIDAEVILARSYSEALNIGHNVNYYTTTSSYGRPGMPKDLVNSYLNKDGSRFTDLENYNQIAFTEEVNNRDPRLSQTIRTPGYTRKGQSIELAPNLGATVTGYQITKYATEPVYDTNGQSITDLPLFRFGEVVLNYAEAKAELNTLNQEDLDASLNLLKARVNMPNLSLEMANNNPDVFLANQYPNVNGSNKGVILEIRRERRIELYMEDFRWDDVVRWKAGETLTQAIRGMYFPGAGEYDLTGDGETNVVLYNGERPDNLVPGVQYYEIGSDIFLDDNGLIEPHPDFDERSFNESKDYLYPIPRLELQLNPNLEQNPGW